MTRQFRYANISTKRLAHFSGKVFCIEAYVDGYDKETLAANPSKYEDAKKLFRKTTTLLDEIHEELNRRHAIGEPSI